MSYPKHDRKTKNYCGVICNEVMAKRKGKNSRSGTTPQWRFLVQRIQTSVVFLTIHVVLLTEAIVHYTPMS